MRTDLRQVARNLLTQLKKDELREFIKELKEENDKRPESKDATFSQDMYMSTPRQVCPCCKN